MKKTLAMMSSILLAMILMMLFSAAHAQTLPQDTDWYTAGANYQRTSWVSEEVRGNLNVEWYRPIEPYIPYKVQPIATNGKIYISTSKGLYALNATNGNVDFVYPTELPLGHSPTVVTVNSRLTAYVGGYDRKIHAIDANTGQPVAGYTPYEAGAGFETNPLVINDTIYAGNRDGYFYSLDAITGALKWRFKTDGPILFSAAYKNNTLYFASQDNHAYALRADTQNSDGEQVWKSQKLPGNGFYSFWPVIYTDKTTNTDYVIFDSGINYRRNELSLVVDEIEEVKRIIPTGSLPSALGISGDWVQGTEVMDASVWTNYFENKPYRRTVLVLNAANGQEFTFDSNNNSQAEYAPFNWSGTTYSGSKYPPVINGLDGVYYQQLMYDDLGAGIPRGAAVGWKFGTQYVSRVAEAVGRPNTTATDEPTGYSSGGRMIYWSLCCDRAGGAYDTSIPFGQPNRAWTYISTGFGTTRAPGYGQMYNDGTTTYSTSWEIYSGRNQSKNGVYAKHGTTQSSLIPYQGKLYTLKGNALLAFSQAGQANPATSPLQLASIISAQTSVNQPNPAELQQKLETEVQKMVNEGHLRPGYLPAGNADYLGIAGAYNDIAYGEIFDYFSNPSETIVSLLQALPYLSPVLQSQVRTYLQTNYGPGAPYDFTNFIHIGWGSGTKRETADVPPEFPGNLHCSPLNPSPWSGCGGFQYGGVNYAPYNFYAAWKYAQEFGNSRAIFDAISNKLAPPLSDSVFINKPFWLNQYLAGYLGYLNLRQMAGYADDTAVRNNYNHMLSLRTSNFGSIFKDTPYATGGDGDRDGTSYYNRILSISRNFMFLVPELADYMNQTTLSEVQTAVDEYTYVAPYWFVTKFDNTVGEGTLRPLYDSPALFQAKAYILKQPYSELAKYLDVPGFARGDLFYIQNLVAALNAAQTTPSPTGDVNNDAQVNVLDVQACVNHILGIQNLGNSADVNQDGSVDVLDVQVIVNLILGV